MQTRFVCRYCNMSFDNNVEFCMHERLHMIPMQYRRYYSPPLPSSNLVQYSGAATSLIPRPSYAAGPLMTRPSLMFPVFNQPWCTNAPSHVVNLPTNRLVNEYAAPGIMTKRIPIPMHNTPATVEVPIANHKYGSKIPYAHLSSTRTFIDEQPIYSSNSLEFPRDVSIKHDFLPQTLREQRSYEDPNKYFAGAEQKIALCKREYEESCFREFRPMKIARSDRMPDLHMVSPTVGIVQTSPSNHVLFNDSSVTDTKDNVQKSHDGFDLLQGHVRLYRASDESYLTQLQCFVRKHCIDVFTADPCIVDQSFQGNGLDIVIGQVGLRCSFCRAETASWKTVKGSIYFPRSIDLIYSASMNLIQRHFFYCPLIPPSVKREYCDLKSSDARSGGSKKYWIQAAHDFGLVDTPHGVRYSATMSKTEQSLHYDKIKLMEEGNIVPIPNNTTTSILDTRSQQQSTPHQQLISLCSREDRMFTTRFVYRLMRQITMCNLTESDRLGKRKDLPIGFRGIACRHCIHDYGTGRFFPSTIKTLADTSKTMNILHAHILKCRKCPTDLKIQLNMLRASHAYERDNLIFGNQKTFFTKVWKRLHPNKSCSLIKKTKSRQSKKS